MNLKDKLKDLGKIPDFFCWSCSLLSNLCRESAAKGKLKNLGLDIKNLLRLSNVPGYEYLKSILALKSNNSLEFDPMNQKGKC